LSQSKDRTYNQNEVFGITYSVIIIRRIEKKAIFLDDRDKEHFLDRLGPIARVLNISSSAVSKATDRRKDIVNYSKTEKIFLES